MPPREAWRMAKWLGKLDIPILVLAMLLAATSVAVGFATDDYGFHAALEHRGRSPLDLFRFAPGDLAENHKLVTYGVLPWWSAPDLKLHFCRPLTGLLFALDSRVFGNHAIGYHVHSLLWLFALLLAARLLFRRFLPAPAATIALAVFAFRAAHVLPYAWLSARHVLVAAVPAAFAFLAHTRGRWIWASLLLIVAFAGSEAALAIVPFFVAYDVAERRWKRSLPAVVITIAYLAMYRALGFGARASGAYHDPIASPLAFLRVLVTRVPMLLADALFGVPVSAGSASHVGALVICGLLGTALVFWLLRRWHWLAAAALCGLVVGSTGLPGGRVLVIPDLGFSALVALAVWNAGGRWWRTAGGAILVLQHVLFAPLLSLHAIRILRQTARGAEHVGDTAEIEGVTSPRVFLVAESDPFVFLYPKAYLADVAPGRVRCWTPLSGARGDHRVTRTGPRSITIEPLGAHMLEGFDNLYRSTPLEVGASVRDCGAEIRVEGPDKIEVTFDYIDDLENAGTGKDPLVLLHWDGQRLARFSAPPIGESTVLAWSTGPGARAGL